MSALSRNHTAVASPHPDRELITLESILGLKGFQAKAIRLVRASRSQERGLAPLIWIRLKVDGMNSAGDQTFR